MAKYPGWEERTKRMLTEYGTPTSADAEWADGIIFGTPTRFGNTSAELKAFIDSLGGLWLQGKLNGKAAGAFTSTGGPHGGNEMTVVSLYIPMAHLGVHHRDARLYSRKGSSRPRNAVRNVSGFWAEQRPANLGRSRGRQASGRRVAQVAAALKTAK
jgi:NAD(P)H dehydrogenase (quinone)